MISKDSVIATDGSFIVADKVIRKQILRGWKRPTRLLAIRDMKSTGLFIETKHFSIIVSPLQKFILDQETYTSADKLAIGDTVMTSEGFEEIVGIITLDGLHDMCSLYTDQNAYFANSFLLLVD